MPDGSPVPVVAIFDDDRVALSGAVPSQQALDSLLALVAANNQFPDAPVDNQVVINPDVPVSVGVRILELTSAVFPENSADILPDHALQLDRVVATMTTYPNVTAVIVAHADQRGSNEETLLLSRQRAEAIVAHLVSRGIDGTRLSARAGGEDDLLSVGDEASLAFLRRSALIVAGLFVPVTPTTSIGPTTTVG